MTVKDLLIRSLQDLNLVPDGGGSPDPADVQLAFDRLNDYIDDLKNDGLAIYTYARVTWPIVPNQASYPIGAGATVNVARPPGPNAIQAVAYLDTSVTPNYERPIRLLTDDQYEAVPFKGLTAVYPNAMWFDGAFTTAGYGNVYVLPIPTAAVLQGVIYAPTPVGEFTSLTDPIYVPPGYRRFFRAQTTIEIASAFQQPPPPSVVQAAKESLARIKRTNTRLVDRVLDVAVTAGSGRPLNIYTGF